MESKDLIIRKSVFDDCKYFAVWEKETNVTDFFSFDENHNYEEIIREFILWETDDSKLQFTIVLKDDEKPIGRIYISKLDTDTDSLDITRIYIGDMDYRGKGYGEESMRLLLEYLFLSLHMERVSLDHFTDNKPASSLYQKLGFKYEGIARNATKKNGKYIDLQLMSMLRSEYFQLKK